MPKRGRDDDEDADEGLICLAITSHGSNIFLNENTPEYINVPRKITYYDKITYTPLGLKNVMGDDEDEKIIRSLKQIMSSNWNADTQTLVNILRQYDVIPTPATMRSISTAINSDPLEHARLTVLNQNTDQLYQYFTYTQRNPVRIINKNFSTDEGSELQNINVVFQTGGRLSLGETILGSRKLADFYRTIYEDDEDVDVNKITTLELLEFLVYCGYSRVRIVDYSCDVCATLKGDLADKKTILEFREQLKRGKTTFGRGGKKSNIFKKTKKTKKSKKSNIFEKTKKTKKTKNVKK